MSWLIIVVVAVFCFIMGFGACALFSMNKVDELEDKVAESKTCLDDIRRHAKRNEDKDLLRIIDDPIVGCAHIFE